jgi:hypothetical protein
VFRSIVIKTEYYIGVKAKDAIQEAEKLGGIDKKEHPGK